MSSPVRLLGLSGSLRKESFSTAILSTLAAAMAAEAEIAFGDVGALPHYNQDNDGDASPPAVIEMRKALANSHGLLIVTSEFNHSIPGVLKNAIDWLSRPAFKSVLVGKPTLFITSSPAFTGGVRAQAHLREALVSAFARPIMTHEVVIGSVHTKITNGRLTDAASLDHSVKALKLLIAEAHAAK